MEQEATDELLGGDGGDGVARFSVPVPGGFAIPERDGVCVEAGDAAVADGDPVGVSGEVAKDLLGVAEGLFRVDVPVLAARGGEHGVELGRIGQMGNGAMALDTSVRMGAGEFLEESASEEACEDFDGDEEGAAAGLPLAGVDIEAGVGDDAMQMGMEQEQLIPGMQDRGAANTGCAVMCIGGDGAQGLGGGAEQEVEYDGAVR